MSVALSSDPALRTVMRQKVEALQRAVEQLPQFEPDTKHYFHAGMYCREVFRPAHILVIGAVHKQEHFYVIASGSVRITDGSGDTQEVHGPAVICSKPGTKRAVLSLTPTTCMTFHRTDAKTVEEAEAELVESEPSPFTAGNRLKNEPHEVLE